MSTIKDFDLAEVTTFRMGPRARSFTVVTSLDELKLNLKLIKERASESNGEKNLPVMILGGGSNTIINDQTPLEVSVIKIELKGLEIIKESDQEVLITVGAGENWDDVVARTVELGLSGLEALSAIPGTAGATPIQNVGAYGVEISDVLISVQALEISTGKLREFTNADCEFKYRDSIFKHRAKGKYVITAVTYRLSKHPAPIPNYAGVKDYLANKDIENPTTIQIRNAIIEIRGKKLPDPKLIASVGSFFKNPIVTEAHYGQIKKDYPNAVAFPYQNNQYKIGAGWMLETLGFKGQEFGNLLIYPDNALVMVNNGGASFNELKKIVEQIKSQVKSTFNIDLEIEPEVINGQL